MNFKVKDTVNLIKLSPLKMSSSLDTLAKVLNKFFILKGMLGDSAVKQGDSAVYQRGVGGCHFCLVVMGQFPAPGSALSEEQSQGSVKYIIEHTAHCSVVYCSKVQSGAYNARQSCVVLDRTVQQGVYSTLQGCILLYRTVKYGVYSTLQGGVELYRTVKYGAYSTMQCHAVL